MRFLLARRLVEAGARVAITSTTERIFDRLKALPGNRRQKAAFVADLTDGDAVLALVKSVEKALGPHVAIDLHAKACAPVEFCVPEGRQGIAIAFGTDVPHMPRWGRPLLIGPGSILDAHTDHEKVAKRDLQRAAVEYERAARWRDQLGLLDRLAQSQRTVGLAGHDADALGVAWQDNDACVAILQVREGRVLGREAKFLRGARGSTRRERL